MMKSGTNGPIETRGIGLDKRAERVEQRKHGSDGPLVIREQKSNGEKSGNMDHLMGIKSKLDMGREKMLGLSSSRNEIEVEEEKRDLVVGNSRGETERQVTLGNTASTDLRLTTRTTNTPANGFLDTFKPTF